MSEKRGGYRHGRKRNEEVKISDFHCYIKAENHAVLRQIADGAYLTHGEVVDKLVEGYVRRKERKQLVPLKDSALISGNTMQE